MIKQTNKVCFNIKSRFYALRRHSKISSSAWELRNVDGCSKKS